MTATIRLRVLCVLITCLFSAAMAAPSRADAGRGEDRVEARTQGVCGRASSASLRLRAEEGRIRVDLNIDTSRLGLWRVSVLHERRLVSSVKVRATRAEGGFEYRTALPDLAGPDAVWVRAVSPKGVSCAAGTTLSDP